MQLQAQDLFADFAGSKRCAEDFKRPMNMRSTLLRRQECGAVLIVSLIMLAVLTLFVISMIKTSIIELKIGGASQTAAINLAAADAAVDNFLALNGGRFAPGFLLAAGAAGPVAGSFSYTPASAHAYGALGSTAVVTPVQLSCGAWSQVGTMYGALSLQAVQFDVRATSTGLLNIGSTTVHQGIEAAAPSGAC